MEMDTRLRRNDVMVATMRRFLPLAAFVLLAPACATTPQRAAPSFARLTVTDQDRTRLRDWRSAFTAALAQARAGGYAGAIASEGALLQPDAALGGGIPNGTYRCRIIKLGARTHGMLPYVNNPTYTCRIAALGTNRQSFAKLTGPQRQVGTIRPHDQIRSLFTGTLVLGDETRALTYGTDRERDLAGWVERVGERRWRLLLPYPAFENLIGVVELVPSA